jgi:2-methylcitrate dehydratase PrpD
LKIGKDINFLAKRVSMESFLEEAKEWANNISISKVPNDSLENAKLMIIDTIFTALISSRTYWAKMLLDLLNVNYQELFPILSVMYDYDSTLLYYGHLGHGIASPLLFSIPNANVSGKELMEAVISSVEISARVAASLSVSRTRGQSMTSIHALSTAVFLSKLYNQDLKNSMGLSLSYMIKPTSHGFGSLGKLYSASLGVEMGYKAFRLAKYQNVNENFLTDFLKQYGEYYLKAPLGSFNKRWHVNTLSVKKYPACAYAQTLIEGALEISQEVNLDEISEVTLRENMLTYFMDKNHERIVKEGNPSFTLLQFYSPYLLTVTIKDKGFGVNSYDESHIKDPLIWKLAYKVNILHDVNLTIKLLNEPLPFGVAINEIGADFIKKFLGGFEYNLRGVDLNEVNFEKTRKYMGIIIDVKTKEGRKISVEKEIVDGFHGTGLEKKREVVNKKFLDAIKDSNEEDLKNIYNILYSLEKRGNDELKFMYKVLIEEVKRELHQ